MVDIDQMAAKLRAQVPPDMPKTVLAAADYWLERARHLGDLPRRSDLNPVRMKPFLPQILLLDVIEGGANFRFRVYGSGVERFTHGNYTGKLITEVPVLAPPGRVFTAMQRVATTAQPEFDTPPYAGPYGAQTRVFSFMAPLVDDQRAVAMLIVALDFVIPKG